MDRLKEQHLVINLDRRKDRLEEVGKELKKIGIDKINRFPAIARDVGLIGCTESHIRCLQIARKNKWDMVAIFEDDVVFIDPEKMIEKVNKYQNHNWDVLMMGARVQKGDLVKDDLIRVRRTYCMHAYIVRSKYYSRLISNLQGGLAKKKRDPENLWYNNDVVINEIIPYDKWYCFYPILATQRVGWSDNFNIIHDQRHSIANPRLDDVSQ